MVFVGIDLHKRYTYLVVLNASGEVLDERRLSNQAVAAYVSQLTGPVHVTLEATFDWQYMVEQMEAYSQKTPWNRELRRKHPQPTGTIEGVP
jgi:hypothetical protein